MVTKPMNNPKRTKKTKSSRNKAPVDDLADQVSQNLVISKDEDKEKSEHSEEEFMDAADQTMYFDAPEGEEEKEEEKEEIKEKVNEGIKEEIKEEVNEKEEKKSQPLPGWDEDKTNDDGKGEWITPTNVHRHKARAYGHTFGDDDDTRIMDVSCMTADFAMQVSLDLRNMYFSSMHFLSYQPSCPS